MARPERIEVVNDFLELAVTAHGGLDRWKQLTGIAAHVSIAGTVWAARDTLMHSSTPM